MNKDFPGGFIELLANIIEKVEKSFMKTCEVISDSDHLLCFMKMSSAQTGAENEEFDPVSKIFMTF